MGDKKALTLLKSNKQRKVEIVEEYLKQAIENDFEEIVILGIKGGEMEIMNSPLDEIFRLMGMIEILKLELYDKWNND